MLLEGKRIGLAVTGSFCTFKRIYPEIENLVGQGAEVIPILSESVDSMDTRFGTASEWKMKFEAATGNKSISTIIEAEPIGPGSLLDIVAVIPCTGNTLAKLANGITDTAVTMAVKANLRNGKPVVIAISTNDGLGTNAKNLALLLNTKNIYFVPFGQDDPERKHNSLMAKMELLTPTIVAAMEGRQLQPVLIYPQ